LSVSDCQDKSTTQDQEALQELEELAEWVGLAIMVLATIVVAIMVVMVIMVAEVGVAMCTVTMEVVRTTTTVVPILAVSTPKMLTLISERRRLMFQVNN
uniref:Col_cuticle_N domain-containing protein n=1 Tax=Anisakis simplex TaxID=6269 RepID=A0A0M3JND6_ANISI